MPLEISWGDIRAVYETGAVDLARLCKMCRVTPPSLMTRIKSEGWKIPTAIDLAKLAEFEIEEKFIEMAQAGELPSRNDFRARIAARVEKMLAISDDFSQPVNDRAAAMRLDLYEKIQKVGERAYGLDQTNSGPNVLINLGALKSVNEDAIEIANFSHALPELPTEPKDPQESS